MIASKERENQERYLKENLDVMARKLGELQARLVQVESLGGRVASLAGLPKDQVKIRNGAGGILVSPQDHSLESLLLSMEAADAYAQGQSVKLATVESRLFGEKIRQFMLPTSLSVVRAS